MTKDSQVGSASIYEAGDQRTSKPPKQKPSEVLYEEGQKNSHLSTDSKDQRSIANRLAAEEKHQSQAEKNDEKPVNPTQAAINHGNEPSRGAKIDAELQAEDEAILAKKSGKTDSLPGKK